MLWHLRQSHQIQQKHCYSMHCPYPLHRYFSLRKAGSGKSRCCLQTAISSILPNSITQQHNNPAYLRRWWHCPTLNPYTRLKWDLVSQCYCLCDWKVLWKHQAEASKHHQVLPLLRFFTPAADSPACPSSNYISSFWVLLHSFLYCVIVVFISLYNDIGKKITPFKAVQLT